MDDENGRWVTINGTHVFIKDGQSPMDAFIRQKGKDKKYIGNEYTPENVNYYFQNISNYDELEQFRNDYFKKIKFMPYIVPIKHSTRQWVDFIEKIDNNNISFSVLSEDTRYSRKTKSSIKNFVKNYKVHQE